MRQLCLAAALAAWAMAGGGSDAAVAVPVPRPKPPGLTLPEPSDPLTPSRSWAEADIAAARAACRAGLSLPAPGLAPVPPRGGPDACGAAAALSVSAFGGGEVEVSPEAILTCPMTAATTRWLGEVVQPAAREHLGRRVTGLRIFASYACRRRYGRKAGRISEHARANALDIGVFVLDDGTEVSVLSHWFVDLPKSRFLRDIHRRACNYFGTVLGPEANYAHWNHFHLDLGRGGVCE